MRVVKLYVDELGMSHPKSYEVSPYFILAGCAIDEQFQQDLENHANNIKFKYWGRTNIIFHSAEIARNLNEYNIFENSPQLKEEFYKDIFNMLHSAQVFLTAAVINKEKAYKSFWGEETVISRSAEAVFYNFLAFIYTKRPCRGKVIIEASSGYRDEKYLKAFNYLLTPNFASKDSDFEHVRNHLTSINFVTKQNYDIESQVADLLAYGVKCRQDKIDSGIVYEKKSYEARIVDIVEHKLMRSATNMGVDKKKFFDKIKPVAVMPLRIKKPKEKRA